MAKSTRKKSTSAPAAAPCATPLADFIELGYEGRCTKFVQVSHQQRVSFSEMGKLHYLISEDIAAWNAANPKKKPRTIYGELRELGVNDKSISNASYSSRMVRDLVTPGHITEAQYDALTFQDCLAVARAMSSRSALPLDGKAVGQLIHNRPEDFDRELACIFEHGMTEAERQAQEEKKAADAAKALADAAKAAAAKPTETAKPAPTAGAAAPAPPAAGEQEQPQVEDHEEDEDQEQEQEEQEPSETSTQVAPTNITPMPQATDPDAMLPAMLDVLAEVGTESEHFTPNAQQALLAKLDEVRATIAERLAASEPASAAA